MDRLLSESWTGMIRQRGRDDPAVVSIILVVASVVEAIRVDTDTDTPFSVIDKW